MTPDDMKAKATELMRQRFHCSQAVLAVGLEKLGMESPDAIKALGLFGGGICGTGGVCGCLSGGMAAISMLYSRSDLEEKENPRMWKLGHMFDDRFTELTEEFGSHDCKDIARVDWTNNDEVREFYKNPGSRREHCLKLVGEAAKALGEIIEQEVEGK